MGELDEYDVASKWLNNFIAEGNKGITDEFYALMNELTELRQFKKDHEWQPIETAPRGFYCQILLLDGIGRGIRIGNWDERLGWIDSYDNYLNPTHWMPLPKPPEEEK